MSTPNRTEINRENAQHSTGPKTRSGKLKCSLNALRHGLTGQMVVMPTEDLAAYQRHVQSLVDEYRPQGATETLLVQALADASWRLNRAASIEANFLTLFAVPVPDAISGAVAIAAAMENQSKTLSNLSLHTQRLSRQFERTVTQLRDLQQIRQDQEKRDLDSLVDVIQLHKDKKIPYNPSDDGFVFTESQILAAQHSRNRDRLIKTALMHRYAMSA
jgi:hypothetical protein